MTSELNLHSSPKAAATPALGTLLWIGERESDEFRDLFNYCQSFAPQVAIRQDISDALSRPAVAVAGIVVTRQIREQYSSTPIQELVDSYPDAEIVQLLGSLCAGERPRSNEAFGDKTIYWHQWNQFLPQWLSGCGVLSNVAQEKTASIVVVANQLSNAQPLLDVAASSGATAIWCKRPNGQLIRNIDAVWWDDSAANPTTTQNWIQRISEVESLNQQGARPRRCRHVWLTSWPRREQIRIAMDGGIDFVISKPFEVGLLYDFVQQSASCDQPNSSEEQATPSVSASRAA